MKQFTQGLIEDTSVGSKSDRMVRLVVRADRYVLQAYSWENAFYAERALEGPVEGQIFN